MVFTPGDEFSYDACGRKNRECQSKIDTKIENGLVIQIIRCPELKKERPASALDRNVYQAITCVR